MKHARDQAEAERGEEQPAVSIGDAAYNRPVNARITDIQGAVARVAAAAPHRHRLTARSDLPAEARGWTRTEQNEPGALPGTAPFRAYPRASAGQFIQRLRRAPRRRT